MKKMYSNTKKKINNNNNTLILSYQHNVFLAYLKLFTNKINTKLVQKISWLPSDIYSRVLCIAIHDPCNNEKHYFIRRKISILTIFKAILKKYFREKICSQINYWSPMAEKIRACSPPCQANCAESGVESSIPFAASGCICRTLGVSVWLKLCFSGGAL